MHAVGTNIVWTTTALGYPVIRLGRIEQIILAGETLDTTDLWRKGEVRGRTDRVRESEDRYAVIVYDEASEFSIASGYELRMDKPRYVIVIDASYLEKRAVVLGDAEEQTDGEE